MKKIANTLSVVLVLVLCAGLSISVSAKQTAIQYMVAGQSGKYSFGGQSWHRSPTV